MFSDAVLSQLYLGFGGFGGIILGGSGPKALDSASYLWMLLGPPADAISGVYWI